MIRGSLFGFGQQCLAGAAFGACTACSEVVLGWYGREGVAMVEQVLGNPDGLEEVSGLAKLKAEAQETMAEVGGGLGEEDLEDEEWAVM